MCYIHRFLKRIIREKNRGGRGGRERENEKKVAPFLLKTQMKREGERDTGNSKRARKRERKCEKNRHKKKLKKRNKNDSLLPDSFSIKK